MVKTLRDTREKLGLELHRRVTQNVFLVVGPPFDSRDESRFTARPHSIQRVPQIPGAFLLDTAVNLVLVLVLVLLSAVGCRMYVETWRRLS